MGVIKRGILGGFQNKVGPVVGTNWKGISVIKSRPVSVANPNSPAQQVQRNAMKAITIFLRSFGLDNVRLLNNNQAVMMSGYNRCVKKVHHFKPGNELSGHVKCVASGSFPMPVILDNDALGISVDDSVVTVDFSKLFLGNPQPANVRAMVTIMDPDGTICTPAVYGTAVSPHIDIDCSKLSTTHNCVAGVCYISEDGQQTSDVATYQLS